MNKAIIGILTEFVYTKRYHFCPSFPRFFLFWPSTAADFANCQHSTQRINSGINCKGFIMSVLFS